VRTLKFRHNSAIAIAGFVAFLGSIPIATIHPYLLPIMVVPALVAIWGWRSGTDADAAGLRPRALLAGPAIPWSRVTHLVPDDKGRVHAALTEGRTLRLPAVTTADLPRLVAASGHELVATPGAQESSESQEPSESQRSSATQ
jgi:hypothetical protein